MAYNYFTNEGIIKPDTSTTLAEVQQEFRDALGADLPVDPSTPQGVLITAFTEERDSAASLMAQVANQINPDIAGGIWLDAIWALMGGQRQPAERSILNNVAVAGVAGTFIPKGSLATATNSNVVFRTQTDVYLDITGNATVTFESVETGAYAVGIGGLDAVASSVLGWETVINPSASVLGRPAQSDVSSRRARRRTLAIQGASVPEAIQSAVYNLAGVQSLSFTENITNATIVIDGKNIVEHSIYMVVDGGSTDEIAMALLANKTLGANYNGALHQVTEPFSGQVYDVKFDRPTEITLFVRVTARKSVIDLPNAIPNAVMQYARGELEGDSGLEVGKDVSPFEISGAINQVYPSINVTKVELSTNGTTWATTVLDIKIFEVPRLTLGRVSVIIV